MKESSQKPVELLLPPAPAPQPKIDDYSYTLGFSKGYETGASSIVGWAFGMCAILAVLCCFAVLWNHLNRLSDILSRQHSDLLENHPARTPDNGKVFSLLLPLAFTVCLAGCAVRQGEVVNPAPVPPDTVNAPAPADSADKGTEKFVPHDASYREDGSGQYLAVHIPADPASGPRKGEPDELVELLEIKGADSKEKTAVQLMRPKAIREAARLVTFQTAMSWRYGQLVEETERYSAIMDTAFNFSPLMLTQGEALIMPPLLTRAGASMRIEDDATATAAKTTYELLEPARYIAVVPNWREFLMADDFPAPEQPHPAVLPKNAEERAIWRTAVREAWAQGLAEADQLYADNVSRMARSYRGVMLYHLLTAQHLLSRVNTASSDLGMRQSDNGNKLNIGQKVYRITSPSAFTVAPSAPRKKGGK